MIVTKHPENVSFSRHAIEELGNDDLSTVDAINVLKSQSARIEEEGEQNAHGWTYRLKTNRIVIVVAFISETQIKIVTAWRIGK